MFCRLCLGHACLVMLTLSSSATRKGGGCRDSSSQLSLSLMPRVFMFPTSNTGKFHFRRDHQSQPGWSFSFPSHLSNGNWQRPQRPIICVSSPPNPTAKKFRRCLQPRFHKQPSASKIGKPGCLKRHPAASSQDRVDSGCYVLGVDVASIACVGDSEAGKKKRLDGSQPLDLSSTLEERGKDGHDDGH